MLIGNVHRSNVIILAGLFFAAVGLGFAYFGETQYVLVSLMIASISNLFVPTFVSMFELSRAEAAFAKELEVLSSFAIFGLLPGVYMMTVAKANPISLIVFAFYLLAVGIRMANFNRSSEFHDVIPENQTVGVPVEYSAVILPLISLLGFVIPVGVFQYILMLVLLALAVGFIVKVLLPKLPNQLMLGVVGIQIILCMVWILLGSYIK